jgi:hypothetical protein
VLRFYETPAPLKAGRDLINERFTRLRRAKNPIPQLKVRDLRLELDIDTICIILSAKSNTLIECLLSFVRRPLRRNKKLCYFSATGETQKEALRTFKTADYGQLTKDA